MAKSSKRGVFVTEVRVDSEQKKIYLLQRTPQGKIQEILQIAFDASWGWSLSVQSSAPYDPNNACSIGSIMRSGYQVFPKANPNPELIPGHE